MAPTGAQLFCRGPVRVNGPAPAVRWCRALRSGRRYCRRVTSRSGGSDDGSAVEREPLVCARCGIRAVAPQPTWTLSVEGGARRYYCEGCSRDNLRAIEGRLDSQWW